RPPGWTRPAWRRRRSGSPIGSTRTRRGGWNARECAAKERRHLHLASNRDGDLVLAGLLDVEGAATLSAALDPLAAPTPGTGGIPDPRPPGRRLADALVELARRALAGTAGGGRLPDSGGDRPTVFVTMTHDALRGRHRRAGPDRRRADLRAAVRGGRPADRLRRPAHPGR